MKSTLLTVSSELEKTLRHLYADVHDAANAIGVDWLIIGATARDLVYRDVFGCKIRRATKDVDFAIHIENWGQFDQLTETLTTGYGFSRTARPHRFKTPDHGSWIDIVPFGGIADSSAGFTWPEDPDTRFSTLGFNDSLTTAISVLTKTDPVLALKVLHPAMFVLLKMLSWDERRRRADAQDAAYAMIEYISLDNEQRVFDDQALLDDDFEYEIVGARLVGRDIRSRASRQAAERLMSLIERESSIAGAGGLLADMALSRLLPTAASYTKLLLTLRDGLND